MITHTQAAQAMGMKEREIVAVDELGDGYVVTTFDGQRTELRPDGTPMPAAAAPRQAPAAVPVQDAGDAEPEKPKKTTRGSRAKKESEPAATEVYPADAAEAARLAWVGEDKGRATAALEYERGRDEPEPALIAKLEQIATA